MDLARSLMGLCTLIGLSLAPAGCRLGGTLPRACEVEDLDGDFRATQVVVKSTDGAFVDGFDDDVVDLTFDGDGFTTTFTSAGVADAVETTGTFFVGEDEVTFEPDDPFLPGFAPGPCRFVCVVKPDDTVRFESAEPIGFDFDGDGTFEDADFEAIFARR